MATETTATTAPIRVGDTVAPLYQNPHEPDRLGEVMAFSHDGVWAYVAWETLRTRRLSKSQRHKREVVGELRHATPNEVRCIGR